jgi:contact-dependent growth inhibition (CDI) system CdiI-like immunity protein
MTTTSTRRMSDFPALENFLSAYFHQDWRVEHDTPDALALSFIDGEDDTQVGEVRNELARLASMDLEEAALGDRLRGLGTEYDPTREGGSWRGWLAALRERFG